MSRRAALPLQLLLLVTLLSGCSCASYRMHSSTSQVQRHRTQLSGINTTCFNEARANLSRTPPTDGHFLCPELDADSDLTDCCGPADKQFCCSPWDSIGMRWAVGIGVAVGVIILMALGYTIQLFRACDRCYHEFPILCQPGDSEFAMDTRWYSVSHEGNRYGVTFHSKRFASHFMRLLEAAYGPWNAANILRIRKDDQDFVVLHIFFNDFFTPWFYTQGPIKNDEEWIRSDFKDLCYRTQSDLAVNIGPCCPRLRSRLRRSENIQLIIVPPVEESCHNAASAGGGECVASDDTDCSSVSLLSPNWATEAAAGNGMPQQQQQQPVKKDHRPWTKHTFKVRPPRQAAARGGLHRLDSLLDPQRHRPTTVIREDIIECYGNDKCIQTRHEITI